MNLFRMLGRFASFSQWKVKPLAKARLSPGHVIGVFLFSLAPMNHAQENLKAFPVTYWDFDQDHPLFEGACGGGKGMVSGLDADRKPIQAANSPCPNAEVNGWFRPATDNARYCRDLVLTKKPGTENTFEKTETRFFPINDVPTNENIWSDNNGGFNNYHFCMEMHANFKYRGGEVFDFAGDDDVWVFINGKLAIDLGGVHSTLTASVALDASAAQLGITKGEIYPFDFFFCERQTTGSSLKITTSIDIIPPLAAGYHIADSLGTLLRPGDTLTLIQGGGKAMLRSVETSVQQQVVDCSDISQQLRQDISVAWKVDGAASTTSTSIILDPAVLAPGTHAVSFDKDGQTRLVYVRVTSQPQPPTPALAMATGGVYLDMNGDGRIESATLTWDQALTQAPQVAFDDPFLGNIRVTGVPSPPQALQVTYAFAPFAPGTGFAAKAYAHSDATAGLFAAQDIILRDGVGPVAKAAKAMTPGLGGNPASLILDFSEPVTLIPGRFPANIKRGSNSFPASSFVITEVTPISLVQAQYTFAASSPYPIPGDSLQLSALVGLPDTMGNKAMQTTWIPVGGDPAQADAGLSVTLEQPVAGGSLIPGPVLPPAIIIQSSGLCLNCPDPVIRQIVADSAHPPGPTFSVASRSPFSYSIKVFDQLGQFVNATQGEVDAATFARLQRNALGDVRLRLTLLPIAHNGNLLGTGAYIVQTRLASLTGSEAGKGSQGETIVMGPAVSTTTVRVGFIRR